MKRALFLLCLIGCGQTSESPDAGQQQPQGDDFPSPGVDTGEQRTQQVAPNTKGVAGGTLVLSAEQEPLALTGLGFLVTHANDYFLRAGDVALAREFIVSDGTNQVLRLNGNDPWLYGAPNRCYIEDGIVTGGCYFDDINQMIHRLPTPVEIAPGAPVTLTFTFDTDWRARNDQSYKVYFVALVSQRPNDFTQSVLTTALFGFSGDKVTIRDPTTFCDPIVGGLYGFGGCCGTHAPLAEYGQIPAYSLIQRGDEHGVAVLGYDGKIRPIRSSFELTSWYALDGPLGFPDVTDHLVCNRVISVPPERFDSLPQARSLTLRPGLHVVQGPPPTGQLYVIARGRTLRKVTQQVAAYIYPDTLGERLLPLPQEAIDEYHIGADAHGPGDYDANFEFMYSFMENETQ